MVGFQIETNHDDVDNLERTRYWLSIETCSQTWLGVPAQGETEFDHCQLVTNFAGYCAGADRDRNDFGVLDFDVWARFVLTLALR